MDTGRIRNTVLTLCISLGLVLASPGTANASDWYAMNLTSGRPHFTTVNNIYIGVSAKQVGSGNYQRNCVKAQILKGYKIQRTLLPDGWEWKVIASSAWNCKGYAVVYASVKEYCFDDALRRYKGRAVGNARFGRDTGVDYSSAVSLYCNAS